MDFGDWVGDPLIHWLVEITLAALKSLWKLLSQTALTSPDVTTLPQVKAITRKSLAVVNLCFVLAIITAGITVMTHHAMQIRYSASELLPRLVVGWIAANFSMPICRHLIRLANALTGALTGEGIAPKGAFSQLLRVVVSAMSSNSNAFLVLVIGLVIAALTGMLLVTWLVRLGVLILLVGIAPVALACHSLPYTDGAARLWWRSMLAVLGTVMLQALALHTALRVFLDPKVNIPSLGIPKDPTGTLNLFIVACLLWVTVKIPGLMRRYVTQTGGGRNVAGAFVRMVLIQQLTRVLWIPFARAGRAAAVGSIGTAPRAPSTASPPFRPQMPRPVRVTATRGPAAPTGTSSAATPGRRAIGQPPTGPAPGGSPPTGRDPRPPRSGGRS